MKYCFSTQSISHLRHRSLKAKHLKEIADENLRDKNFRAAWER